jgi:two-component system cell cycle sensor histidine kinase PleC
VSELRSARERELEALVREGRAALARADAELEARAQEIRAQQRVLAEQRRLLEQGSAELERAQSARTELLANLSHELRTPLNTVIGFSDLLLDPGSEPLTPRQARFVEDILASGRHLLLLINDILDLVRMEAGQVSLQLTPFSPEVVVREAVVLVGPQAAARRIRVRAVLGPLPRVRADGAKLLQVLLHLLVNAVKFSPEDSEIVVGAVRTGGFVRFHVRDEGVGIAPELRPHLFAPFVRGGDPFTRCNAGTGLGLAICRQLLAHQGGALDVESVPGHGAEFWFTLPLAEDDPDPLGEPAQASTGT